MGDLIETTTWAKQPFTFYRMKTSAITFEVKGSQNAAIGLSNVPKAKCDMLLALGDGNNQRSWILQIKNVQSRITKDTPNILSVDEYRRFWLTWYGNQICIGSVASSSPLINHKYTNMNFNYITFFVLGSNNPLHWKFELPPNIGPPSLIPLKDGSPQWIEADDQLPEGAIIGGYENECLYIIRATHRGSLTPGKFVPSEGTGYLAWGGASHAKEEFDVLCGYNFMWIPTLKNMIPNGAVIAGHSEVNQECLYVGRAVYEGHLIPGKIQPSHKCCYIPYNGREIGRSKYEILICPDADKRIIKGINIDFDSDEEFLNDDDDDGENNENDYDSGDEEMLPDGNLFLL